MTSTNLSEAIFICEFMQSFLYSLYILCSLTSIFELRKKRKPKFINFSRQTTCKFND